MTDARLPEKWLLDRRLSRLDPVHFVSYSYALMWSVSNRTDGLIEPEDLALIPRFADGSAKVLVAVRLWTALRRGWQITDFVTTQTSRNDLEVLENIRATDAAKKRRRRAAKAAGRASVPGDGPGDTSPGTAQDRTGQDRPGQEGNLEGYGTSGGGNGSVRADLGLCLGCGENPALGDAATPAGPLDPLLCESCNDAQLAEMRAEASS